MASKKCLRCLILLLILIVCVYFSRINFYDANFYKFGSKIIVEEKSSSYHLHLKIKKHLLKALRYTRSQNVRSEILNALSLISNMVTVEAEEIKDERIAARIDKGELQDVCMEKFLGVIDHPLYFKGQGEIPCKKKPFKDVLTFVVMVDSCSDLKSIRKGIMNNYGKSNIVFGTSSKFNCDINTQNINLKNISNTASGMLDLLENVKTEYVLIAPNLYHFDNTSRIERLVEMVSYTGINVAAGGVRLEDGRFESGCYQMAVKMYTMKMLAGYDMSSKSCLHCDYSPAPFVARTSFLMKQFTNLEKGVVVKDGLWQLKLFTNLMINNQPQIFVCPDVLFHVKPYDLSLYDRKAWLPFVSWFSLNRLLLDGGKEMNFDCQEAQMSCYKKKGLMVPLCCLKELSHSLKFMNRYLQQQNVTFEVLEGTVMGGLKFNNILFWELDADTNFRVHDIDRLEAKIDVLTKQGYTMTLAYECPYKRDHEKCRHAGWHGSIYYAYSTPNWRTEMYGVTYILSDFRGELKERTKINIDGEWYYTYTNPVQYARNIYGGDAFQHVEHRLNLGQASQVYLQTGSFSKCPQPGFHGCLDNFAGEGGLQFQDIYI